MTNPFDNDFIPTDIDSDKENEVIPTSITVQGDAATDDKEVREARATKYAFALNDPEMDKDYMERVLSTPGAIERERESLSLRKEIRDSQFRNEIIEDMARQAGQQNRTFTPEERTVIEDLSSEELKKIRVDPKSFFEKEYAARVVQKAAVVNPEEGNSLTKYPDIADALEDHIAKSEGYKAIAEDAAADFKAQSWGTTIANVALTMVPFYQWYHMSGVVEKAPSVAFLPGSNLRENIEYLHHLPAEEAIVQARQAYDELKATNQIWARDFANALLSYTQSDAMFDNLMVAGVEAASFLPLRTLKGAAQIGKVKASGVYRDFAKVVAKRKATVGETLDAAGDIGTATSTRVAQEVAERAAQSRAPDSWSNLVQNIPSIFNPTRVAEGTYNLSTTAVNRIISRMGVSNERLIKELLIDPIQAGALNTPEALNIARREVQEGLSRQYSRIENGVLDVSTTNAPNAIGGVVEARVAIGTPQGNTFDSFSNASFYRDYVYGLKEATVVERGAGFHIEIMRPLDLTTDSVRDVLTTKIKSDVKPLSNIIGQWLTPIRTGDDTLPKPVADSLKVTSGAATKANKLINDMAQPLTSLKKKDDLYSYLQHESGLVKPGTDDISGSFSRTVGELEQKWMSHLNRLPTEQEVEAYYAYVRLNDMHYLTRNIDLFMEKTNRGHMEFSFRGNNVSEDAIKSFRLENLEGRIVTTLPNEASTNTRIMVMDDSPYVYNSVLRESNSQVRRAKELMDTEGYVLIQLSPEGVRKLGDTPAARHLLQNGKVNYVLAKDATSRPIPFKQLPYVEGGRRVFPQGHYVSVPNVSVTPGGKKTVYYGDDNLFFAHTAADAREIATRFDSARVMLSKALNIKRGRVLDETANTVDLNAVRNYVKQNLPITWREFRRMYIGPDAKYDIGSPVLSRPSNQNTASIHKIEQYTGTPQGVENFAKSEHNSYRGHVNLEYAQERGDLIREVVRRGDPHLPEFGVQPATTLDPISSMNQALKGVAQGRNMNSMKLEAGERFVTQFEDILDVPLQELRSDPITHMMNASFKKGADPQAVRDAKAYRGRMQQFLGVRSEEMNYFDYMAQKLLQGVSPDMATGWRKNFYEVLQGGDALNKFKSIAFHARIGLWNPKQLILQAQTAAHVTGLAGPVIGMKAIGTSMVQGIGMESIKDLSEYSADFFKRLGWGSKDDYLEATEALVRTGYDRVGREVATREQHFQADIISTGAANVLDHGLVFFNRSEAFIRRTSWNAAYLEWRAANPKKKLKDNDIVGILSRADLMNVNMTQASNAAWQKGWTSIPTQFWSYQVRLTEQLLSKRLTNKEKRRILYTYSTLYGIPVAGSAAVGVWPVHENIRSYLLSQGIETDDGGIKKVLNDGLVGITSSLLLGEDDNAETVFGPSGIPFIKDVLTGETSTLEALFGASGGVFTEVILDVAPVVPWVFDAVSPGREALPPKLSDFTDMFTNISTGSTIEKIWIAMSTGEYLSKYGEKIDTGNTGAKAIFQAVLGIQPQRIEDMYTVLNDDRSRRNLQREMKRKAFDDMRRMLNSDNPDDMKYWQTRAKIRLNTPLFTPSEQVRAAGQFFRENATLMEKTIMRQKNNPKLQELLRKRYLSNQERMQ